MLSTVSTRQALQNELGKFYTKSDVDGLLDQVRKGPPQQAVTRPELNAAITSLANEIQERDRQLRKSLGDQIRSLDDRTSTIPSWVSLSASLVALCAAIWVGWRARVNATAIKARFTPRTERADRLVDEYASKPSERPGPTV
jgi:cell division septum initiation protein DivIVA